MDRLLAWQGAPSAFISSGLKNIQLSHHDTHKQLLPNKGQAA
jgi:hypothetical protein